MKILMAISGGVDSSTAALKLKEEGHSLVGVMMEVYKGKPLSQAGNSCYGISKEKEVADAKAVCEKLGVDFHLIDCSKYFEELVLSQFRDEYLSGRTPNPCILCNPRIKFDILPELAAKKGIEFDKFATGHYARIKQNGRYLLYRGLESKKDQSYFLYGLSQEQLSKTLFPLGDWKKEQTRKYAQESGLFTFDKGDSQDFFKGDYSELLKCTQKPGEIVLRDGSILGKHDGIHNFTIGQRKGIKIAYSEPLYVLELNHHENKVIVGTREETFSNALLAKNLNLIALDELGKGFECTAKHRSTQTPQKCYIETQDIDKVKVTFFEPQNSVTPGQSIVFYDNDLVLGGGIIEKKL